jgi:hypothetical protein
LDNKFTDSTSSVLTEDTEDIVPADMAESEPSITPATEEDTEVLVLTEEDMEVDTGLDSEILTRGRFRVKEYTTRIILNTDIPKKLPPMT